MFGTTGAQQDMYENTEGDTLHSHAAQPWAEAASLHGSNGTTAGLRRRPWRAHNNGRGGWRASGRVSMGSHEETPEKERGARDAPAGKKGEVGNMSIGGGSNGRVAGATAAHAAGGSSSSTGSNSCTNAGPNCAAERAAAGGRAAHALRTPAFRAAIWPSSMMALLHLSASCNVDMQGSSQRSST